MKVKNVITMKANKGRGFTLLELLVVIGIIGILAAIVIVAINPGRQFSQARNAQRWNDVNAMLNAIHQYAVDNNGIIPSTLVDDEVYVVGTDGVGGNNPNTCTAQVTAEADCLDLTADLTTDYLTAIPSDPSTGSVGHTDYYVSKAAVTGRVEVGACDTELGVTISVTR